MHVRRRDFLVGCGQAAAAALLPDSVAAKQAAVEYHLHPHYREPSSLESVLQKRVASLDDFPTEKYHDKIAAILADWTSGLLQSPPTTQHIESVLMTEFRGSSLQPSETKVLRSSAELSIRQLRFAGDTVLGRDAFLRDLHLYLHDLSRIVTAEFQVTRMAEGPGGLLQTEVRYELVGAGVGFHREGRVGIWELEWGSLPSGEYRLHQWQQKDESRSRSVRRCLRGSHCTRVRSQPLYSAQLLHGADYWRTVLDGACRIDIYGHNGVSVGDIDGDGWDDLYICQPAGLPNRLFRNRRDGTFEDITESSGLGILENTACAIFADFDNDGRQDLIVVRADGPVLFLNQGDGQFRQQPDAFQFANAPQGTFTGAAAADYDRDGWLDIYFCLYVYYQGTDQYKYPTPYYDANNGPPNFLMRNNRNGTFGDATAETGLNQNNTRYSFCCGWTDFNGNGWPDLYVVNDFGRKNFYRNNGNGTFTDIAEQAGVEDVGAGMSVCCFDYDNDGSEDLYVADMWTAAGERITGQETFRKEAPSEVRALYRKHAMGNSLFRNKGAGLFEDKTVAAGVGMGRWSWSSDAWDFDHDGFPDLYVTNGMVSGPLSEDLNSFFWRQVVANSPDEAKPSHDYEQGWNAINELIRADYSWSGFERNVFYANNRDGTFSDVSAAVGLDFLEDGRSFALADFDRDGRLEVLLKNRNGPQLRLLKNVIEDLPPSICFRLRGTRSNHDAIGAVVTIETSAGRQTRRLQAGSGFLSQHSKEIFFGLGQAKGSIKASIRWPSGFSQSLDGVQPNCRIYVEEGMASYHAEPFHRPSDLPVAPVPQQVEALPSSAETWLLAPVSAPDFSVRATDGTEWTLSALRGNPVLLYFWTTESKLCYDELTALGRLYKNWARTDLQLLTLNFGQPVNPEKMAALSMPVLIPPDDTGAIYNLLYRSLFDRHRDLSFPTALLIDEQGEIVKIYQGSLNPDHVGNDFRSIPRSPAERVSKALPFPSRTKQASRLDVTTCLSALFTFSGATSIRLKPGFA